MRTERCVAALAFALIPLPRPGAAQTARAADVASPEAVVKALYETVTRAPGERFDWDRMRTLFLPGARMIPNTEQTGGEFRVLTVDDFIAWIDGVTRIGGPNDRGFQEAEIAARVERYGDIAHVFSTYRKQFHGDSAILGRGVNSIQLVRHQDRWWVTAIIWDEETGAGPVPGHGAGEG